MRSSAFVNSLNFLGKTYGVSELAEILEHLLTEKERLRKGLTYAEADKIAEMVFKIAEKDDGVPVSIVVLNLEGIIFASLEMLGSKPENIKEAEGVASVALVHHQNKKNKKTALIPWGVLIMKRNIVVGAVGVFGRLNKENERLAKEACEIVCAST